MLHVRLRAIRHSINGGGVLGARAVVVVNPGIRAIRVPSSLWTPSMRSWSASPRSVPAAPLSYREMIPRRGVIK